MDTKKTFEPQKHEIHEMTERDMNHECTRIFFHREEGGEGSAGMARVGAPCGRERTTNGHEYIGIIILMHGNTEMA